jgi:hypothetical protein
MLIQEAMIRSDGLIPLPIFLHGPTIVDPRASDPVKPTSPSDEAPDRTPTTDITINFTKVPGRWPTAPKTDEDYYEKAREAKMNGLPKLMTALYKALSGAICEAWRQAASHSTDGLRGQRELHELMAHLDRLLERTPSPETLRKIWARAGFLKRGVSFYLRMRRDQPNSRHNYGRIPKIAGWENAQGVREILALSACAEAFLASISKNNKETFMTRSSYDQWRQQGVPTQQVASDAKKAEENKAKDMKDAGGKIGPPAIGAVAGLVALQGFHPSSLRALLLGVIVWSISWFAWNYTTNTKSVKNVSLENLTEVDWTEIRVLERRFPTLIDKVKNAGFAPIFVLDELDKLRDPDQKLDAFLSLTKHIATDSAAFFFLVNRDFYENLERMDRGLEPVQNQPR